MLVRTLWAGIAALLIACALAQAAPASSGDLQTCLRDSGNRYAGPGAAVDDQYSDAAGACQGLDAGGVQVIISPSGSGDGAAGSSGGASSSGGPPSSPSSPGAGATSGGGSSSGSGASPSGGSGSATGGGPAPPSAASSVGAVRAALARADAGSAVATPSAFSHAPAWLLILGGGLVVAIGAGAVARKYRPGR